jgi:hypothetical protein
MHIDDTYKSKYISPEEIDALAHSLQGLELFKSAFANITTYQFVGRIGCYVEFNSIFPSVVASLAAKIGCSRAVFVNPSETVLSLQDESYEVAAYVFAAAVDEFGGGKYKYTHRNLAKAFLSSVAAFYQMSSNYLNECLKYSRSVDMLGCRGRIERAYLAPYQDLPVPELLVALGFHAASEYFADLEFNALRTIFEMHYPELLEFLRKRLVSFGSSKAPASQWLDIHTSVESDHYRAALMAIDLALLYSDNTILGKRFVLQGFSEFVRLQSQLCQNLITP